MSDVPWITCDGDGATTCPQGRVGMESRGTIVKRSARASDDMTDFGGFRILRRSRWNRVKRSPRIFAQFYRLYRACGERRLTALRQAWFATVNVLTI